MRSITLWRATLTSQARGLSGIAVCDHCVSAAANASCIASSAYSKSPTRRIRVASTRPASARNTASVRLVLIGIGTIAGSRLAHHPDWPHLDRAVAGARTLGRDRGRLVEVLGLDHVEAAELLAGLGERAVGCHGLAVADANGGRARHRAQALTALEIAVLDDALGEAAVFGHGLGDFGLRAGGVLGFVAIDQQ